MAEYRTTLLKTELEAWDGKSKDVISAIYERHRGDTDFLTYVVRIAREIAERHPLRDMIIEDR